MNLLIGYRLLKKKNDEQIIKFNHLVESQKKNKDKMFEKSIKVAIRIRSGTFDKSSNSIQTFENNKNTIVIKNKSFSYDYVFDQSQQIDFFSF